LEVKVVIGGVMEERMDVLGVVEKRWKKKICLGGS
jgi:hypothetical protein